MEQIGNDDGVHPYTSIIMPTNCMYSYSTSDDLEDSFPSLFGNLRRFGEIKSSKLSDVVVIVVIVVVVVVVSDVVVVVV